MCIAPRGLHCIIYDLFSISRKKNTYLFSYLRHLYHNWTLFFTKSTYFFLIDFQLLARRAVFFVLKTHEILRQKRRLLHSGPLRLTYTRVRLKKSLAASFFGVSLALPLRLSVIYEFFSNSVNPCPQRGYCIALPLLSSLAALSSSTTPSCQNHCCLGILRELAATSQGFPSRLFPSV